MRPAAFPALFVLLLLASACDDDDRTNCEVAKDKVNSCVTEIPRSLTIGYTLVQPLMMGDDCSGMNGCVAACLKDASCDAMRWIILDHPTDPNAVRPSDFATLNYCLAACIDTYQKQ